MKTKLMTLQDATGFFRDGMTIMVGGFMGIGTPSRLVEALLESGVRDLTLIAKAPAAGGFPTSVFLAPVPHHSYLHFLKL